ncbi:MAG: hypothetical protein IKC47_03195 [Clostridia bacterium]|nr:hypothetical protein [Clostridia bacterium]
MSNKSKYIRYAVAATLIVAVALTFSGQDISSREIIVGVGVDYDGANQLYQVCAEVVSPGGGQNQQTGTFSKFLTGTGATMEQAFTNMYSQTGMTPSLGQCQILALGKDLYTSVNLKNVLAYFVTYHSFKDNSNVCCVDGSAKQLLQTQMPLSHSLSLTLSQLFADQGETIGTISHTVNDFVKKQMEQKKCACANLVSFLPQDQPTDSNSGNAQLGVYDCQRQVVFKDFVYVTTLNRQQSNGYTLLKKGSLGQIFIVQKDDANGYQPKRTTVGIANKKVDTSCHSDDNGYTYQIQMDVLVRSVRTGQISKGGLLFPKSQPLLDQQVLNQAKQQVQQDVQALLDVQQQWDVDVIDCYQHFYVKYKDKWDSTLPVKDIKFKLSLTLAED